MSDEITVATYEMPDGTHRVEITHQGQMRSFTPAELSEHINVLANVRENLLPPVRPDDPQPGETVAAIVDPRWHVSHEPFIGGALLQIRHPAFGWLGYGLPIESLQALHHHLGQVLAIARQNATNQKPS
ncbi:hypothetical protein [Paraburkholderia tropica]|uniref:hypothetical protein n=1 Tax=Paraburkholderia tropica TaxID=92647 RepID=UPI002AB7ABC3|nr:hypothetical protein [Paraburkholderia tropica]